MVSELVPILAAPGSSTTKSQSPDYVHPHALEVVAEMQHDRGNSSAAT